MKQLLFTSVFPLLVFIAAASDLLTMRIPNWLSLLLVGCFIPLAFLAGLTGQQILLHVASGALVLMIGFAFFAFGWIGGGDAKFAAATALWLGLSKLLEFTLIAAVYGGLLTLFLIFFRSIPLPAFALGWDWLTRLHNKKTGVPYGIALAAAGLVVYLSSPLWGAAF